MRLGYPVGVSSPYTVRVPIADIKPNVNHGLSPLHQATALSIIGKPCSNPPENGGGTEVVTNEKLRRKLQTRDVGPFKVTGHEAFLNILERGFHRIKNDHPDLYAQIGTEGGLNVRHVRGSKTSWSNHSFGFAVDLTIDGVLDDRGDGFCQNGLLIIYSYFKREGLYWGIGFPTEDSMHFEASDELLRKLHELGSL